MKLIFAIFALIGAVDMITGNRLKLGDEFKKGLMAVAPLLLSMAGLIILAPALAEAIIPVLGPVAEFIGVDPSVISGIIASDMGGASMAKELASEEIFGAYNGLIVGATLGCTICVLPMALGMMSKEYHKDLFTGFLYGIATIPIGCICGGIVLGCPMKSLIINSLPILIFSVVICIGLIINPELCKKIFEIIGKILQFLVGLGLGIGIFTYITGITVIDSLAPIEEALTIVCDIAIMLSGIFPLIYVASKIVKYPFGKLGKLLKINDSSVMGIIMTSANVIPTFGIMDKMNKKGRVLNMAFAASAQCVFGDYLAFTMAFDGTAVPAVITAKLVGGITAVIVASIFYKESDLQKTITKNQ